MGKDVLASGAVTRFMPEHPALEPMRKRGMSQLELAEKATEIYGEKRPGKKISRSLVSMFLIGERRPDEEQAKALSKALRGEVTAAALMAYEVPPDAMRKRKGKAPKRPKLALVKKSGS